MKFLCKWLLQTGGVSGRTHKTSLLQKATLDYPMDVLSLVIKIPTESTNPNQGNPELGRHST